MNRKSTRAKCLLTMWLLWKHRNDVVFNGVIPSLSQVKQRIADEARLWAKAGLLKKGTKGLEVDVDRWVVES